MHTYTLTPCFFFFLVVSLQTPTEGRQKQMFLKHFIYIEILFLNDETTDLKLSLPHYGQQDIHKQMCNSKRDSLY